MVGAPRRRWFFGLCAGSPAVVCISIPGRFVSFCSCRDGLCSSPSGRNRFPPRRAARRSKTDRSQPGLRRVLRHGRHPGGPAVQQRWRWGQGVRTADVRGPPRADRGTAPPGKGRRPRGARCRGRSGRGGHGCEAVASPAIPMCPPKPRDTSSPLGPPPHGTRVPGAPRRADSHSRQPCPRPSRRAKHSGSSQVNSRVGVQRRRFPNGEHEFCSRRPFHVRSMEKARVEKDPGLLAVRRDHPP